ncbi:uncharacterized protein MELLADRAFT_78210 [Melampsora larici-populina 98AG31]|uniref:GTPase-activating protein GYP5 n=1 Tax=Melampsora larici-populina (strain 98AG31 / pathotype 3-4-7) TaxID=747676 RepID=F4RRK5_MELLP|nr:uncharacterized protein MELLADRAFT_78210 [Melampsora larici-populina 98AG31]EGG05010.1 hypothetical protein MELLADRAFT_78210 [Melampsora larici-populina 98AG31]
MLSASSSTNKSTIPSSNSNSSETEISSSQEQEQKIQEDQDLNQDLEVNQTHDDYKRPFSLNSIPRNSLIAEEGNHSIDSFSPPTTPPLLGSNHESKLINLETTPTSNLQRERLLTGPRSDSEGLKQVSIGSSSKSKEEIHSSTNLLSENSESIKLPLRKDSDTSTIWRSSLASVNESSIDLAGLSTKNQLEKTDSVSQSRPVSSFDHQASTRDDTNDLPGIKNLDINLSPSSIKISEEAESKSTLRNLHGMNLMDESLHSTTRLGPTRSGATSPSRTPTGKSFDPSVIHHPGQSPSIEEDESKRKSLLEGRHKLIEHFTRVQEEMTGSNSKTITNSIQEEKPINESKEIIKTKDNEQEDLKRTRKKSLEPAPVSLIDWDFWGSVMNDYETVAKKKPKELSRAIQSGIPPALRGMMWQLMSSSKDVELEMEYSRLLNLPCQYEKSITRDLNRTFPQLEYFKESGGVGQDSLLAVCKAFSLYDEEVGYTQGLQFIIGPMLLNMPDEEAFCVLVRLMNSYDLRSHFIPNMPGLQLRLFQFDRILEDLLPHVYMHLLRQGIKSSMYASQWFLTLFGYRFPLELVSVVMDLVFAEGLEAVFRFGLSLMKKNEKEICERGFDKLLDFLKLNLFEPYKNDDSLQESLKVQPFSCDSDSIPKAAVVDKRLDQSTTRKRSGTDSYRAQEFIKDALQIKITPMMLDQYSSEWESICREKNAHQIEIDRLRDANAQLSAQVRRLESNLAQVNEEHCDLVKQVVMAKLDREELEEELVKYKMAFADLSHQQASEGSKQHRASIISTHSFSSNGPNSFISDSH